MLDHDRLKRPILALIGSGGGLIWLDGESSFPALLEAAKAYWRQWGVAESRLSGIRLLFQELPAGRAAHTDGEGTIWLSPDAAGAGWFVDPTPEAHEEYAMRGHHGRAAAGSPAARGLDALTVLIHETGHILGLNDNRMENSIMNERLAQGIRRLPAAPDALALGLRLSDSAFHGGTQRITAPLTQPGAARPHWRAAAAHTSFVPLAGKTARNAWQRSVPHCLRTKQRMAARRFRRPQPPVAGIQAGSAAQSPALHPRRRQPVRQRRPHRPRCLRSRPARCRHRPPPVCQRTRPQRQPAQHPGRRQRKPRPQHPPHLPPRRQPQLPSRPLVLPGRANRRPSPGRSLAVLRPARLRRGRQPHPHRQHRPVRQPARTADTHRQRQHPAAEAV
ncbi:matrixin family metalloprotease [Kingella potus]|uniref:matrixin family metalloprotease n=1 Tax=Kingella potus TaxID=265175 RepID=UPI001FD459E6|nr:matrixin family metalloprotease [Kingella potus]UOP01501.1 hypothetical protein LVJ84_04735 [Kingella potus]